MPSSATNVRDIPPTVTSSQPERVKASKARTVTNCGIAMAAAGCGYVLGWLLTPYLHGSSAYIIFLVAAAVVIRISGAGASLLTLFLGLVLTHWFFLQPPHRIHLASVNDWVATLGYLFVGLALASSGKYFRNPIASLVTKDARQRGDEVQVQPPPEQQELARQLAAANAASTEAVQQLDSFVYTVSHDLRAPLRAIKGFTLALREDYDRLFDAEGKQYAKRIVDATERLEQMLAALLNYSRLGRGEVPLTKVDLESCLAKLRWSAKAEAKGGQLEIVGPLPAVLANQPLLEHALDQLLSNAFKFVALDTPPRVKIHQENSGGTVRLKLTDNGIGIEPKHIPRLFQVFQRFNPIDAYPGLGIGLAMARKATEKMGGRIGAQSQPGQGSCFWIELPKAG
jgi:signal transduction histidine kinase